MQDQERKYSRHLLTILIGFAMGTFGFVLDEVGEILALEGLWRRGVDVLSLVGWLMAVVGMMMISGKKSSTFLTTLRDDERAAQLRAQAYSYALGAIVFAQFVLLVIHIAMDKLAGVVLTLELGIYVTMTVAVVASLGRFLYLDR